MDKRLYPVGLGFFRREIEPLIEGDYIWKGRPPKVSYFKVFNAILYVLRTGIAWRDLPKSYGHWYTVYKRFKRGEEKFLWWRILHVLQKKKKVNINIIMSDSTTIKYHRHGGGLKGGFKPRAEASQD